MLKKLIIISDWASDSVRCQEVATGISGFLNDSGYPHISFVSVTSSTIHAGYVLEMLVADEERVGRPLETVIYVDCGSSYDSPTPSVTLARLVSGLYVIGANHENEYSCIKSRIEEFFTYTADNTSQKPNDVIARVIAHLLESKQDDMDLDEAHTGQIPELSSVYIGHIDSSGTIYTTLRKSELQGAVQNGQIVTVSGPSNTYKVPYHEQLELLTDGEISMSPSDHSHDDDPYIMIKAVQKDKKASDTVPDLVPGAPLTYST